MQTAGQIHVVKRQPPPFVYKQTASGEEVRDAQGRLKEPIEDPVARLQALSSPSERGIANAWVEALIAALIVTGTEEDLAEAIQEGRQAEIVAAVAAVFASRLTTGYNTAVLATGANTAEFLRKAVDIAIDFDVTDPLVVNHLRLEQLRHVREVTATQRELMNQVIARGVRESVNPVVTARRFRESLSLTAHQNRAVANYRAALERIGQGDRTALRRGLRDRRFDPTLERAAKLRQPLTTVQMDRMEQRYRERALRLRAQTIARTEALRAIHTANDIAYRQAINGGALNILEVEREWWTALDERVRGSHAALHGITRRVDETFPAAGGPLRYPGDPEGPAEEVVGCRCTLLTRLVPF